MSSSAPFSNKSPNVLKPGQLRVLGGLLLVALGVVFLLREAGVLADDSNWWVIFIALPGLALIWVGITHYLETRALDGTSTGGVVVGLLLLILSAIFVFDPTWSFTRGWNLEQTFPFLRDANWDLVWQWGLVVVGALLMVAAYLRRNTGVVVFGAVLAIAGLVSILKISWDVVWPLAIVAVGVGVLFSNLRRPA